MDAVVVYESMFGNTRDIAHAIAEGLATRMSVRTFEVGGAPHVFDGPGLLVVGGPTHAFSMSRSTTRDSAQDETDDPLISRSGIREWLDALETSRDQPCATFDTKVPKPRLPGSAAAAAAKRLRKLKYRIIMGPETFWVEGTTGPLLEGEQGRARAWGEQLAEQLIPA
jgi:hypothetical protein